MNTKNLFTQCCIGWLNQHGNCSDRILATAHVGSTGAVLEWCHQCLEDIPERIILFVCHHRIAVLHAKRRYLEKYGNTNNILFLREGSQVPSTFRAPFSVIYDKTKTTYTHICPIRTINIYELHTDPDCCGVAMLCICKRPQWEFSEEDN